MEITLLTQDACAFCTQTKELLSRLQGDYEITVREVALDTAEGERLALAGGFLFPPGILIDGEPFSYGRPSERKLRRALAKRLEGG